MTREEIVNSLDYKLTQASAEYYRHNVHTDSMTAFEDGAEWMKAFIIEEASRWIESNRAHFWHDGDIAGQFKQAMENR